MTASVLALSRRQLLAGVCAGVAGHRTVPAFAAAQDTVETLIEETIRRPRALRDAALPFAGDPMIARDLPDNSYDYHISSTGRSRGFAARARRLHGRAISPQDAETLGILIWDLERDVALTPFYWHEFPLSYGSSQVGVLSKLLGTAPAADTRWLYLSRLRQAPGFVDNIRLRLLGQIERRLTPPRAEAVRAAVALSEARSNLLNSLVTIAEMAAGGTAADRAFEVEVKALAHGPLTDAFNALRDTLEQRYIPRLDEVAAVARAEDARDYHRELISLRVSTALDPIEAHETAQEALAAIDQELEVMRRRLGGGADAAAFHAALARDPRWIARDPDDVALRLNAAAAAAAPLLGRFFSDLPKTPYRVAPLPGALSKVLLNGYYQGPTNEDPRGTYYFNTSGLDVTTWAWAKSLITHELMPGHHLQFAKLFEATALSPYRRSFFVSGYGEGWGEYARRLMEEGGLYADDPWGLYASRLLDRRFALRTVVETGVHSPHWTWQQADAALASDPLTRSGTTRQLALAAATFRSSGVQYWLGLRRFRDLRRVAQARAGANYDLRQFHEIVMRGDSVPFMILEQKLNATWPSVRRGS